MILKPQAMKLVLPLRGSDSIAEKNKYFYDWYPPTRFCAVCILVPARDRRMTKVIFSLEIQKCDFK